MSQAKDKDGKQTTRVLIGIDDSIHCERGFEYYAEHIHKSDNDVILFHVSDQVTIPIFGYLTDGAIPAQDEIECGVEKLRKKNKQLVEKYDAKCKELHMAHKFILVTEDVYEPGHGIVEAAAKYDADLIVVGSRGLGALSRSILGSTSSYVIHHGHVPALVCPPRAE